MFDKARTTSHLLLVAVVVALLAIFYDAGYAFSPDIPVGLISLR